MLTAPFNFVPLSSRVFNPDWADKVSQDVPFSDGEDGVIELEITNHTPLFTRNGHRRDENTPYSSHILNPDGTRRYFIPGSTLRGCFRSVLEIMSFGKMERYMDSSFGLRDFRNNEYKQSMRNVRCGWLYCDGDKMYVEDCGEPQKVLFTDIDRIAFKGEKVLANFISNIKGDDDRLARTKYEVVYKHLHPEYDRNKKVDRDKFIESREYLLNDGNYVLTGQSSKCVYDPNKKKPIPNKEGETTGCYTGKAREYVFPNNKVDTLEVSKNVFVAFETVHAKSKDYVEFWQLKLKKGQRIPVFFNRIGNNIESMGLTYLYKHPYRRTVKDGVPPQNMKNKDLADCILGCIATSGKLENSLKGRVVFGHAFCENKVSDDSLIKEENVVLGTPSASYYPLYLMQNKPGQYFNYHSDRIQIAGRKRYDIIKGTKTNTIPRGTPNVSTTFRALPSGCKFKAHIVFHNLRKAEIGALLSAISFHETEGCFHNIGLAKSYGYGKISCKSTLQGLNYNEEEYLKAYETALIRKGFDIQKNIAWMSLMSIASEHNPDDMQMMNGFKQYAEEKKTFQSLKRPVPKFYCLQNESAEIKHLQEEWETEQVLIERKEREEQEKKRKLEEQKSAEIQRIQDIQRQIDYLTNLATANMGSTLLQNALQSLKSARELASQIAADTTNIDRLITECKAQLQTEATIPLEQKLTGKTSLGNIQGTVDKWCKTSIQDFSEIELLVLKQAVEGIEQKEQKKLPAFRAKFEKSIGKDWTDKLYQLLN